MTLKKALLAATLVAAGTFAFTAQAASGTIAISGKVLADTCTVLVNGGKTVALPTVMTGALSTAGDVAGATDFDVKLTGCDANATSATMVFNGSNIDSTSGNLTNTVVGGSSAQIQLLEGASVINTSTGDNAPVIPVDTAGAGSVTMTAQYVAVGAAASAGLVQSSVDFTLTYL